jgi:glyceraldehyde 3-phosphate dehydrogenase
MSINSTALMNGFGRFGIRFLNYYLNKYDKRQFNLLMINDEYLSVEKMHSLFLTDPYLNFGSEWTHKVDENTLSFHNKNNSIKIPFFNLPITKLPNNFDYFFECSGRYTELKHFPTNLNYKRVFISATSYSADQTLIYGYNERELKNNSDFISYGSCTVNAFTPLANVLHNNFEVLESDVSVIHNVPKYKLENDNNLFLRKECTLLKMGPKLLQFLNNDNFWVNYTLAPFLGPSRIDFRFKLGQQWDLEEIFELIEKIESKDNVKLYKVRDEDNGNFASILSDYSAEILRVNSSKVGKNLYLGAYFDNENSVNRYFDLINFVIRQNK